MKSISLSSPSGRQLAGIILTLLFILLLNPACTPEEERKLLNQAADKSLLPEELLEEARKAIIESFSSQPMQNEMIPAGVSELGVFVRLRREYEERGCFTYYRGVDGPIPWLAAAARNAAFTDPRYPPLSPEEKGITLEVAVIGELVPMSGPGDFIPGFHTVFIRLGDSQAILQAPLAVQRNLNGEEFLTILSVKAGLSPKAWLNPEAELLKAATIWAQAPLFTKKE